MTHVGSGGVAADRGLAAPGAVRKRGERSWRCLDVEYLGRYLVRRGVITEEQLDDALAFQRDTNRRLGQLAVEEGLLTEDEAARIHDLQRDDPRRFGDIAVTGGQLTRRELDRVLFLQKVGNAYLGEALLARGHIGETEYAALMRDFLAERENVPGSPDRIPLSERLVLESLAEAFVLAVIRFVGEHARIKAIGGPPLAGPFALVAGLGGRGADGTDFTAVCRLSGGLADRLGRAFAAPSSMDDFFAVVLRYFVELAARAGLRLGDVAPLPKVADIPGRALSVILDSPAGPAEILLSCRGAAGSGPEAARDRT